MLFFIWLYKAVRRVCCHVLFYLVIYISWTMPWSYLPQVFSYVFSLLGCSSLFSSQRWSFLIFQVSAKMAVFRKDYLEYLIKNTSPLLLFLFIPEMLLPQYRKHFVIIYLFTCVPLVYNFMKGGITPLLFTSVWVAFSTGTW